MKKALKLLLLALLLTLISCGGDDGQLLSNYTGESPTKGPLAFWDSNMTWDQECWQ